MLKGTMSGDEDRNISTYETYVSTPSERTVLLVKKRDTDTWQERIGLYEPTGLNFWRLVLAEFVFTLLFTIIACGSTLNFNDERSELHEAICVGQALFVLYVISSEKFGYLNPALSFGLLVARKISFIRFFVYVAVQIGGSCAGAGLLYLYTPEKVRGHLGTLSVHGDISSGIGFLIELTMTFIVMMAVMTTRDPANGMTSRVQSSAVVGVSFIAVLLMGIPYTGAGVNPGRAFGPAAITGNLVHEHWVYWIGPLVGALLAAVAYDYIFKLSPETQEHKHNDMPTVQLHIKSSSSNSNV